MSAIATASSRPRTSGTKAGADATEALRWFYSRTWRAGAFGKLQFSEGEYHHYHASKEPTPSYKGWRRGLPPMWYPTHATAYYVNVTGERLTHVSCIGTEGPTGPGQSIRISPGAPARSQ